MIRTIIRILVRIFWQPIVRRRIEKTSHWKIDGMTITVMPGVFHPRYFYSSRYMHAYLQTLALTGQTVLDVGCGSGFLSVYCAKNGANVSALDINPTAIENTMLNAKNNHVQVRVFESDLFKQCPLQTYDLMLINPPYYPRKPQSMRDHAWYCGTEHEYFTRFFQDHLPFVHTESLVLMVLTESCDLKKISGIARISGLSMKQLQEKAVCGEKVYLYSIQALIKTPIQETEHGR